MFFSGCVASRSSVSKSSIDARYIIGKISTRKKFPESSIISIYQKYVSKNLGSDCTMFPHDSLNAQLTQSTCGPVKNIFYSMHRWYFEPDAPMLDLPVVWSNREQKYWDISNVCQ